MKKLILGYRLTNHQKFILFLAPAVLLLFIKEMLLASLNFKGYIFVLLCLFLFIFLVVMVFSRRGLVVKNDMLYIGVFYFNILIFKKHIDLSEWTKLSILKFRRKQKFAFFTSANPDLSQRFNFFDICLLNEKHTRRQTVISLKNEEN